MTQQDGQASLLCSRRARRDATRREAFTRERFCYLRHDYLRGVGTLACASSSLNYRLILPVFWNAETTQTSSLPASWMRNASLAFRPGPGFRSGHVTLPSTCRWPRLLVAFPRDWPFPVPERNSPEVIWVKSKFRLRNTCTAVKLYFVSIYERENIRRDTCTTHKRPRRTLCSRFDEFSNALITHLTLRNREIYTYALTKYNSISPHYRCSVSYFNN